MFFMDNNICTVLYSHFQFKIQRSTDLSVYRCRIPHESDCGHKINRKLKKHKQRNDMKQPAVKIIPQTQRPSTVCMSTVPLVRTGWLENRHWIADMAALSHPAMHNAKWQQISPVNNQQQTRLCPLIHNSNRNADWMIHIHLYCPTFAPIPLDIWMAPWKNRTSRYISFFHP